MARRSGSPEVLAVSDRLPKGERSERGCAASRGPMEPVSGRESQEGTEAAGNATVVPLMVLQKKFQLLCKE